MRPGLRAAKKHAARACAAAPTLFTLPHGPTHHALGFLDARDLAAVQTVSLSARASCGTEPHTEFSAHWRASLRVGDRLDARDCESRWFEAEVVGETRASGGEPASEGSVRIHFKGWATSFDQEFSRASPDLVPLFSHSTNWRPKLRKGKLIEGKKGKCWFLALITRIERAPGAARWTALDAIGVSSRRDADTLNVLSSSEQDGLHRWRITDFDSEVIANLGTHVRPKATKFICLPVEMLLKIQDA